eukprot:3851719-Rhodomonas_salina.1
MTYEEQIEASAAVQQWLSKIPGWSERLLALKMDIMLLFGVKSGSQVYEDTVQVFDHLITRFMSSITVAPDKKLRLSNTKSQNSLLKTPFSRQLAALLVL